LNFINTANLRVLTEVALPRYLSQAVQTLGEAAAGSVIDLQGIFLEITSQLMGTMAYNVRYEPVGNHVECPGLIRL
jgi:hypothetical protein